MNEQNGFNPTPQPVDPNSTTPVQPNLGTVNLDSIPATPAQPVQPTPVQVQPQPNPIQPQPVQQPTKNNNTMIIIIIVGVIALIVVGILGFKALSNKGGSSEGGNLFGGHKNQTGLNYDAKDVTYNCTYEETKDGVKVKAYMDVLFNYKNYGVYLYAKSVKTYDSLSDEQYLQIVKDADISVCVYDDGTCSKDHVELGLTNYGNSTVIDRKGNEVTMTYNSQMSYGQTASDSDKAEVKSNLESSGLKCN